MIGISIIYILLVLVQIGLAPPANEIYKPHFKSYCFQFVLAGIAFWGLGVRGIKIISKKTASTIGIVLFIFIIEKFLEMWKLRSVMAFEISDEFVEYYQFIPYLIMWLSLFFFFFTKKWRVIAFSLVVIFIILSTKRGPLISMGVAFMINYFLNGKMDIKRILSIAILLLLIYGIASFFMDKYIDDFIIRFTGENTATNKQFDISNNRYMIWYIVISDWLRGDVVNKIFGFGYEHSHILLYNNFGNAISAHNDFLDVLYNWGIVGISIFIGLIYSYFKIVKESISINFRYGNILIICFVFFVTGALFSSNMNRYSTNFFGIFFYYFAGIMQYEKKNNCHIDGILPYEKS